MNCDTARPLLNGYADRELDVRTSLDVGQHLQQCASCAREAGSLAGLKTALRDNAPYYRAPAALQKAVLSSARAIASEEGSGWRLALSPWRWPVAAAAAVVLAAIIVRGLIARPSISELHSAGDVIAGEVVASHVRSMMANHLTDILSSNQHTVKPWFNGKLDFAPTVQDLSAQGFPLAGGRLDFLDGRPVAALVYRYRLHIINLFTWPAPAAAAAPQVQTRQGYHTIHWIRSDMEYWAVSDVAPAQLERFAQLLQEGTSSTGPARSHDR